ncbi:MAG: hypothetical protein IJV26_11275 [Lachnospiraceae bacterium]|nr:hypothetical protein [Lachnospiraceae bacterium]
MTNDLIYEKKLRLRSEHVNCARRLRTSSLLRILQEASIAHTTQLGMGRDKTLDRGLLWIISHQSLQIRRMPEYDEDILVRSWPGPMLHMFFPRYYEICAPDGTVLITGSALWLLMSEETRKAVFPTAWGVEIPGAPTAPRTELPAPLRAPKEVSATVCSSFSPQFSRTDINGHMNNSFYYDLAEDLLPAELLARSFPSEIRAEYLEEIRPGTVCMVRGMQSAAGTAGPVSSDSAAAAGEQTWYFEGIRDTGESPANEKVRPLFRISLRF